MILYGSGKSGLNMTFPVNFIYVPVILTSSSPFRLRTSQLVYITPFGFKMFIESSVVH
jgi:hypothetical protein